MRAILILLLLALCAAPAAAERFYKWTDAQGNVHYTDAPPAEGEYETLDAPASPAGAEGPTSAERAEAWRAEQQEAAAERERQRAAREEQRRAVEQREENCRLARENVRVLEQNTRILLPPEQEGGEPVRMSDEERLRRLEEAREKVAEFCQGP